MSLFKKPATGPRMADAPAAPAPDTTKTSFVEANKTDTEKVHFKPGKWRKSLVLLRASIHRDGSYPTGVGRKISISVNDYRASHSHTVNESTHIESTSILAEENDNIALDHDVTVQQFIGPLAPVITVADHCYLRMRSPKDEILKRCNQQKPITFEELFTRLGTVVRKKIGEGVYGEVFELGKEGTDQRSVLKLIPIEGSLLINGEKQKTFEEIVSEIIISAELSNLRQRSVNGVQFSTDGFIELLSVSCIRGTYPKSFIDLWNGYADKQGTENDNPDQFPADQHYIAFETAFGGCDLDGFRFKNALQAFAVFSQIVLCLAVAEKRFNFEHRDLHTGNILVQRTDETERTYYLLGEEIIIQTQGLKATVIDYTLSRIVYNGLYLFNDLSNDEELFTAEGDYQFDIYRMMKTAIDNRWSSHEPKTNVFWLHYLLEKLISCRNYRDKASKVHRENMASMKELSEVLLEFSSVHEIVQEFFSSDEREANKENE
ncbi:serine/threonine-protein kinase haspin homolog [Anopheles bellator]|uniref:serine/threonine-protein kinase haspin homolog n=1 Tax=Anopheles bellator TaxID=139047 RepID=UPI00264950D9|nr:serine/threonine-protein kinase haspin homolog [Anopheles bellator]